VLLFWDLVVLEVDDDARDVVHDLLLRPPLRERARHHLPPRAA